MNKKEKRISYMINNINIIYRFCILENFNDIEEILVQKKYKINVNPDKIRAIFTHINDIVNIIRPYLKDKWEFSRLNNLDKAILINAVYDIKYRNHSKNLIINESVDIAKMFSIDDNYKFINAVLDKIN